MSTFGILLKTYRERAGLSQNELAIQAGLSASTISRVEGGTEDVSVVSARRLSVS